MNVIDKLNCPVDYDCRKCKNFNGMLVNNSCDKQHLVDKIAMIYNINNSTRVKRIKKELTNEEIYLESDGEILYDDEMLCEDYELKNESN